MFKLPEDEYQDPRAVGSLSGALRIWQSVLATATKPGPHNCSFRFSCASELSADRLAQSLRRRQSCETTTVSRVAGERLDTWDVHGYTYPEVPSLSSLERLSTWLRRCGDAYRVKLVQLSLVEFLQ
jgi:hypothetical protein